VLTSHVSPYAPGALAQLWDVASGKPLGEPLRHKSAIRAAAFSPDGKTAIVASDDGTARLCNGDTGAPIGAPLVHKEGDWITQARLRKSNDEAGLAWTQLPWTERLALELLQAEAENLIEKAPAKP
jgi:hypothetical protein